MDSITQNLETLLMQISAHIRDASEEDMARKPGPAKWSKKEIIGHLIDSGINNLQRFTEIQFAEQPFQVRTYPQDELVRANHYQNANTADLLSLLNALNRQIIHVVEQQTEESLAFEIITPDQQKADLRFLIEDYVRHFEHHTRQIVG